MWDPSKEIGMVSIPADERGFDQPTSKYVEQGITDQINGIGRATQRIEANLRNFFQKIDPILAEEKTEDEPMREGTHRSNSSGMSLELSALWTRLDMIADAIVKYEGRVDL